MLSPTDVHLLVGLLVKMSSADAVDVVAGSMQYDRIARKKRDIDVTLTCRRGPDDLLVVLGVEVKSHKRPLTIEQVEQLCAKFGDIPGVKERWIVSSSGFVRAAALKAKARRVKLFDFKRWDGRFQTGNIRFSPTLQVEIVDYRWIQPGLRVALLFSPVPDSDAHENLESLPLLDAHGQVVVHLPTVRAFLDDMCDKALENYRRGRAATGRGGAMPRTPTTIRVAVAEQLFVDLGGVRRRITDAILTGEIEATMTRRRPEFHALRRHGTKKLVAGCAVAENTNGNLIAAYRAEDSIRLEVVNIPLDDRLKKKIRGLRLS